MTTTAAPTTTPTPAPASTPTPKRQVALPASLLMAIHCSALAEGGIGAGLYFTNEGFEKSPCCVLGHAFFTFPPSVSGFDVLQPLVDAVRAVSPRPLTGATWTIGQINDNLVAAINTRRGLAPYERVDFEAWLAELASTYGIEIIDAAEPDDA